MVVGIKVPSSSSSHRLRVVVVGCFDGPPDAWRDRQTFFAGEQITGCLWISYFTFDGLPSDLMLKINTVIEIDINIFYATNSYTLYTLL